MFRILYDYIFSQKESITSEEWSLSPENKKAKKKVNKKVKKKVKKKVNKKAKSDDPEKNSRASRIIHLNRKPKIIKKEHTPNKYKIPNKIPNKYRIQNKFGISLRKKHMKIQINKNIFQPKK